MHVECVHFLFVKHFVLLKYMFHYNKLTLFYPDVAVQQERAARERELDYQPRKVNKYLSVFMCCLLLCVPGILCTIALHQNIRFHYKYQFFSP